MTATPPEEQPFLRRAVLAARAGGVREVWQRFLGVTVYRRLVLYVRDVGEPHDPGPDTVEVGRLEDIEAHRAARPQTPVAELERRLARGDVCGVGRLDGEIVAVRWLSFDVAEIDYLGLTFELPAGVVYVYDVWTRPGLRRSGVNRRMSSWSTAVLQERGDRRLLSAILPENAGGSRIPGTLPMRRAGTIGCVRLPGRRIPVRRGVPPGVIGAARPLGRRPQAA